MSDFFDEIEQAQTPDRSLRSKLNKMFTRYDYVAIKNPLKNQFKWVVALEQNEILGMSPADPMKEDSMAANGSGSFLPGDSVTKAQRRVVRYTLESGEKKMIVGEAAYVIVNRIFSALVRERFGTDKAGLARLRNPSTQDVLLKEIVVGPIINNVAAAMQTYVNDKMSKIDGFTDVQPEPQLPAAGQVYTPQMPPNQVQSEAPIARGMASPAVAARTEANNVNQAAANPTQSQQ